MRAVSQQLKEELGLDVHSRALVDAWTYRPRAERRTVFIVVYRCELAVPDLDAAAVGEPLNFVRIKIALEIAAEHRLDQLLHRKAAGAALCGTGLAGWGAAILGRTAPAVIPSGGNNFAAFVLRQEVPAPDPSEARRARWQDARLPLLVLAASCGRTRPEPSAQPAR